MSEENQIHIPETLSVAIHGLDDDYLADVLRPWDCYAQDWAARQILLCRFESNDLLIYPSPSGLNYRIGPIDTATFDASMTELIDADPNTTCLCWRHDGEFRDAIGNKDAGAVILGCL